MMYRCFPQKRRDINHRMRRLKIKEKTSAKMNLVLLNPNLPHQGLLNRSLREKMKMRTKEKNLSKRRKKMSNPNPCRISKMTKKTRMRTKTTKILRHLMKEKTRVALELRGKKVAKRRTVSWVNFCTIPLYFYRV